MANDWSLGHFFARRQLAVCHMADESKRPADKPRPAERPPPTPAGAIPSSQEFEIVTRLEGQLLRDQNNLNLARSDYLALPNPNSVVEMNFSLAQLNFQRTHTELVAAYRYLRLHPRPDPGAGSNVSFNRVHPPVPEDVNRPKEDKLPKKEVNRLMLEEEANKLKEQQQKTKSDETTA